MHTEVQMGNLKGGDGFGNLEADGRIILKYFLKEYGMRE
jgi:hypothetical protein